METNKPTWIIEDIIFKCLGGSWQVQLKVRIAFHFMREFSAELCKQVSIS